MQIRKEKLKRVFQKLLKVTKKLEVEETIVDKVKKNIKYLDTSINTAHDSLTSHFFIFFSILAAIAK